MRITRNIERVRDACADICRQSIAFVAHDNQSALLVLYGSGGVHIAPVKQGAIDRDMRLTIGLEEGQQVGIVHLYPSQSTHGGLYHFGIEAVGSIVGTEDVMHAKPVAGANDSPQITRVLDAVKGKDKSVVPIGGYGIRCVRRQGVSLFAEHSDDALRRAQGGHLLYLGRGSIVGGYEEFELESVLEFADTFLSLRDK